MHKRSRSKAALGERVGITPDERARIEHAATEVLANANNLPQAAQGVIAALCKVLHWECGSCWGVESESNQAVLIGSWGRPRPAIELFLRESESLLRDQFGKLLAEPGKKGAARTAGLLIGPSGTSGKTSSSTHAT